jgi:type II secretion system protein J
MSWRHPGSHPNQGRARRDSARISDEDGFTLIELLVAVAILALLLTLTSLSFSSTFRILEAVEEDQGRAHQARLCLSRMADELMMARMKASSSWIGRNGDQNDQPADILAFVSSSHVRTRADAPQAGLTRVLYAREGTRLLRLATSSNLKGPPLPAIEQMEMAQGVTGFNLRYYDRTLRTWVDEWDGRIRGEVPTAVMIELTLSNARNETRTFTQWVMILVQAS